MQSNKNNRIITNDTIHTTITLISKTPMNIEVHLNRNNMARSTIKASKANRSLTRNHHEPRGNANLVLLSMSNICFVEDECGDESNVADGDFGSPPATTLL